MNRTFGVLQIMIDKPKKTVSFFSSQVYQQLSINADTIKFQGH